MTEHADPAATAPVRVMRARIEEIRDLAVAYAEEASRASATGEPWDVPIPQGGIFWIARDAETGDPLGYAAGTMRPVGCQVGPVFVQPSARRRGVGQALLLSIQEWAQNTRVPVVEISVSADNPAGQSFLEALGYEPRRVLMSLVPNPR